MAFDLFGGDLTLGIGLGIFASLFSGGGSFLLVFAWQKSLASGKLCHILLSIIETPFSAAFIGVPYIFARIMKNGIVMLVAYGLTMVVVTLQCFWYRRQAEIASVKQLSHAVMNTTNSQNNNNINENDLPKGQPKRHDRIGTVSSYGDNQIDQNQSGQRFSHSTQSQTRSLSRTSSGLPKLNEIDNDIDVKIDNINNINNINSNENNRQEHSYSYHSERSLSRQSSGLPKLNELDNIENKSGYDDIDVNESNNESVGQIEGLSSLAMKYDKDKNGNSKKKSKNSINSEDGYETKLGQEKNEKFLNEDDEKISEKNSKNMKNKRGKNSKISKSSKISKNRMNNINNDESEITPGGDDVEFAQGLEELSAAEDAIMDEIVQHVDANQ